MMRMRRQEGWKTMWLQYMYLRIELKEIPLYKNKVVITRYIIVFIHHGQRRTMAPSTNLLTKGGSY